MTTALISQEDFLTGQKKYERVKTAYKEKGEAVTALLKKESLNPDELNIILIAYKGEQELEVFAKNKSDLQYKKIQTYKICANSGQAGPKRKQGDGQVPEGFYYISQFNPVSTFYLSLGVSYPNASDRKKSKAKNLGGDIFIHGNCVTIGCIPMTDEKIKEIYIYALQARHSGQAKIPVYIFPFRMTEKNMKEFKAYYKNKPELLSFWDNLKTGYEAFEKDKKELNVKIDSSGDYLF